MCFSFASSLRILLLKLASFHKSELQCASYTGEYSQVSAETLRHRSNDTPFKDRCFKIDVIDLLHQHLSINSVSGKPMFVRRLVSLAGSTTCWDFQESQEKQTARKAHNCVRRHQHSLQSCRPHPVWLRLVALTLFISYWANHPQYNEGDSFSEATSN